jgi:hypothetical protein
MLRVFSRNETCHYNRLFEKGELPEPETVASKITQLLDSDNFRSGDLLSIDDI